MKYDLWTRMYLRQYAFLMRHDARMSPNAACHLATLALSGLASLALVAFLSLGLWLLSLAGLVTLLPWSLPAWALFVCSIGIAFLPGMYIDRKMAPLRTVDAELIVYYSSSRQRLFWLMTLLSVVPLAAITAFCLSYLRARS